MHEHDQEMIMALAEGSLQPEAAAAAESAIAGCAECARDLELQRIALSALDDAPAVYLTAIESAQLHQNLRDQLGVAALRPARTRPRPLWARWAGLAFGTAAVLLVAFLVLPNILGGGDDDSIAMEEISADLSDEASRNLETTSAAATEAAPPAAEEPMESMAGAADDAEVSTHAGDDGAAETTAAPSVTTTVFALEVPLFDPELRLRAVVGDLDDELRSEVIEQLRTDDELVFTASADAQSANPEYAACVAEPELPAGSSLDPVLANSEPLLLGSILGEDGVLRLLVAYVTPDIDETVLAAIGVANCLLHETLP